MIRTEELRELTRVRTALFLREPEAMFWVFGFPLVLAAVLGFAFRNTGPAPNRVAVVGADPAPFAERLRGDELLEVEEAFDLEQAMLDLRNGSFDALVLPGDPPELRLDPARPESATARLRLERAFGRALERASDAAGDEPAELFAVDEVEAIGSRYVDFLFPGLIGLNLMGTGMWSIGFAVADLRKRKVLKRLLVTPMRRSSLLASLLLSRLVWLLIELVVLVLFGMWALDVPFRGGLVAFLAVSFVGATAFAGLGLLATARVRTIEGASGMLNLVMMPMWLASGVFFSYERFPELVQPALRLLPLTALNDALRDILLDGEGLAGVAPELAVQAGWGLLAFFLALRLFRWE
ncbi:MAG: ABC transporter permease [Planctomycetota bacterium]